MHGKNCTNSDLLIIQRIILERKNLLRREKFSYGGKLFVMEGKHLLRREKIKIAEEKKENENEIDFFPHVSSQ